MQRYIWFSCSSAIILKRIYKNPALRLDNLPELNDNFIRELSNFGIQRN
tara:strand:- start:853 stop:999 length:147 start_codon:yes stop_codon:yes gene_type:complete